MRSTATSSILQRARTVGRHRHPHVASGHARLAKGGLPSKRLGRLRQHVRTRRDRQARLHVGVVGEARGGVAALLDRVGGRPAGELGMRQGRLDELEERVEPRSLDRVEILGGQREQVVAVAPVRAIPGGRRAATPSPRRARPAAARPGATGRRRPRARQPLAPRVAPRSRRCITRRASKTGGSEPPLASRTTAASSTHSG